MDPHAQSQLYTGIGVLVAAVFLVRRTLRPQTVRIWALIVIPVILFGFAVLVLWHSPPPSPLGFAILVAGAVLGAGLGYARAFHSKVSLGAAPGTLVVEGNGVLVAILLGAFAARTIVRALAGASGGGLSLAISDAFLIFAVASVAVGRGMLFFIWRRLTVSNRITSTVA